MWHSTIGNSLALRRSARVDKVTSAFTIRLLAASFALRRRFITCFCRFLGSIGMAISLHALNGNEGWIIAISTKLRPTVGMVSFVQRSASPFSDRSGTLYKRQG